MNATNDTVRDRAAELLKRVESMRGARGNQNLGDWLSGYQAALTAAVNGTEAVADGHSRQYVAGVASGKRDASAGRAQ